MGLDVTGLTNYVEENKAELITSSVFGSKTISMMTPMTGIKSSEKITVMETDAVFQAGGVCAWNASGTTALTNREVVVGKIKVQEALCPKELQAKWTQNLLKVGSQPEAIPFEKMYADKKAAKIAAQMETAVWQGDTTSATNNLSYFDGLIKNIGKVYSATGVINVNAITGTGTLALVDTDATVTLTGGSFTTMGVVAGDKIRVEGVTYTVLSITDATHLELTAASAVSISGKAFTFIPASATLFSSPVASFSAAADTLITVMQGVYNAIPAAMLDKEDFKIFMGWDTFRTLQNQITNGKYFNYTADAASASGEMIFPGTDLKIVAVHGLDSTNRIFGMRTSNMFFGTDLLNEEEAFEIFYAKEAMHVRFNAEWKAGANVGFLQEVVQFTLA